MRTISQKLALATFYDDGKPTDTQEEFDELARQAYAEFWETSVGQEFQARGGDIDRLVAVFFQRFGAGSSAPHPGAPFVERLIEVGQDLLVESPEVALVAPAPVKPVKPAVNLTPAKPAPTPSKEVTFFAHAYNNQLLTKGCQSVKPKAGFVTLEAAGTPYRFSAAAAANLLEMAEKFGLID